MAVLEAISSGIGSIAGIFTSGNQKKTAEAQRDAVIAQSEAQVRVQELTGQTQFMNGLFGLEMAKYDIQKQELVNQGSTGSPALWFVGGGFVLLIVVVIMIMKK